MALELGAAPAELQSKLKDTCAAVSMRTLPTAARTAWESWGQWEAAKVWRAAQTIYTKGFGCLACKPRDRRRKPGERPAASRPYVYVSSPGFRGVPTHEDFKKPGVVLQVHCSSKSEQLVMNTNNIAGETAAWTYVEPVGASGYQEKPCFLKIPNCALCAGFDSSVCKMCFDGYSLVTMKSQGGEKQACIDKFCPAGQRQVQNFNGITYCQECSIPNCNSC